MTNTDEETTRGPRLLYALAHVEDGKDSICGALYEELHAIRPSAAVGVDRTSIRYLVAALDQRAPDGWGFGVYTGLYGFWPADYF